MHLAIIVSLSLSLSLLHSNFWQIVRSFPEAQKKQLLAFVTGSDRIPLGGLAKLKFIIVKNGPDSDRYLTYSHLIVLFFISQQCLCGDVHILCL